MAYDLNCMMSQMSRKRSTNYIRHNALVACRIASAEAGAFFIYKGKLPRSNRASGKKTHSKTFFLRKKFAYIKNK